ncbi:hypothetical protein [Paenibacillus azoreducens]|nr:hypothetical protein [Paenibacillus azoreducens]
MISACQKSESSGGDGINLKKQQRSEERSATVAATSNDVKN